MRHVICHVQCFKVIAEELPKKLVYMVIVLVFTKGAVLYLSWCDLFCSFIIRALIQSPE